MINCKKIIIVMGFTLLMPLASWAEAPVVDDSDNFAFADEQRAPQAPVARSKYNEPLVENAEPVRVQNNQYRANNQPYEGPALVSEDSISETNPPPSSEFSDNAKLIEKVQSLQKEVQELRGQLEVQAHDLKLLQQQQLSFYKDLDSRLSTSGKSAVKPIDMSMGPKKPTPIALVPAQPKIAKLAKIEPAAPKPIAAPALKINPAEEQINYMAAYELITAKRYDDAIHAMQTFVHKYPRGGYTANAEYWLGELYLVKKDFRQAIHHFDVVLQNYPSSAKSAASMLKSGYAFAAAGDNAEAKKRFEQVISTYPDTPTAHLANTKLKAINVS